MRISPEVRAEVSRISGAMRLTPDQVLRRALRLPQSASAGRSPGPGRGRLYALIEQGHLHAGQTLTWSRDQLGTRHAAFVTQDGWIELDDGQRFKSPSAAAKAVAGGSYNGWTVWRTQDGTLLGDLRS